ncbi:hypothetical protein LRR18_14390 [Mangrovimonas sp. AS39]|uniref:hypothetical protein n=1 Tax=Mangrovimonas futianensis TaxID=2895523 RepID=UPI001E40891B|nr:hypothetical protein [Mangrovimonas futianensis]MCF1192780.1 hypothetical protein [Mangrovimonas futianensis]
MITPDGSFSFLEIIAMYPSFIKDDFIKKHQGSLWGLILQSNHWLYSIFWILCGSLFFSYYLD